MRGRKRLRLALVVWVVSALALPQAAGAHAERPTVFPDPNQRDFPVIRTAGPSLVVCAPDSKRRIKQLAHATRHRNRKLLKHCAFHDIQAAVRAAKSGDRVLVLPGVYRELPSRGPPPPGCEDVYERTAAGTFAIPYEDQRRCPNAQNLVAILGDTDGDRICDTRCDLQIEGTGDSAADVLVEGERAKLNVFRADRADGVVFRNFTVEFSDFNNIYVIETNGFRIDSVVSRLSREYGVLSFTSDHGIYENCETSYNGDSGVYPGSGPDRHGLPDIHGHVYGIVIRNCDSHHNTIGYSGTAGNGIWAHHNSFHHNAIGLTTDSFAGGHPGMPQDAAKWTENLFYSNNTNLFDDERDRYCRETPPAERDPRLVCPTFQVPVGTGLLIAGGNDNIVERNYIFDNWRRGTMQHWVPGSSRGEPANEFDTSANNRYRSNCMGVRPLVLDPAQVDFSRCVGSPDANGVDFWWDENEGRDLESERGNCWEGNVALDGAQPTSDPLLLPGCPGSDVWRFGDIGKLFSLIPCTRWDPVTNPDPRGCDWFSLPPEPL